MRFPVDTIRTFFSERPRSLLAFAQWWTALLPVCLIAGVAISEAALMLIVVCFAIHCVRARDFAWLRELWVRLALLLWAYLMVRALFSDTILSDLRYSMGWLRYVLFGAALAYWTLKDERVRKTLLATLLVSVLFLILDLAFQKMTGQDIFGRGLYQTGPDARLTGPYSMPRAGIMLSWISFPLIAWGLMQSTTKKRLAGVALTAAVLAAVILTGDRMPLLNMLMGLVLTLGLIPILWRTRLLIAAGLVATAAAVMFAYPALLERQFHSIIYVVTHVFETPYGMLWQSAWNIFEAHPVFGAGLHHFRHICPDEAYGPLTNLSFRCNLHPHNVYLEWLSETGMVGLSIFVALVIAWVIRAIQGLRASPADPILIGVAVEFFIRVWPISTTTSVFANWSAAPLMMILGWLFATIAAKKSLPPKR